MRYLTEMLDGSTSGDVAAAVAEARRLSADLDPRLTYHDARHTFEEVVPAALALADDLGVDPHNRGLIEVAAAWHDLGHLVTRSGHEQAAMDLVRDHLPRFGFREDEIERIAGMILATRLPQWPRNVYERIVADADLAVLAAPNFLERNDDLRREMSTFGRWLPRVPWWIQQREFLLSHRYHTPAARDRYLVGRLRNADLLEERQRTFFDDDPAPSGAPDLAPTATEPTG